MFTGTKCSLSDTPTLEEDEWCTGSESCSSASPSSVPSTSPSYGPTDHDLPDCTDASRAAVTDRADLRGRIIGCIDTGSCPLNEIECLDTSEMTDFSGLFENLETSHDLRRWKTSKVRNMEKMFKSSSTFNGRIEDWDTSSVTSMEEMFRGAENFDQPVNTWDTSKVISMEGMFALATKFLLGHNLAKPGLGRP